MPYPALIDSHDATVTLGFGWFPTNGTVFENGSDLYILGPDHFSNRLFVSVGGHFPQLAVWKSTDAGLTWTIVDGPNGVFKNTGQGPGSFSVFREGTDLLVAFNGPNRRLNLGKFSMASDGWIWTNVNGSLPTSNGPLTSVSTLNVPQLLHHSDGSYWFTYTANGGVDTLAIRWNGAWGSPVTVLANTFSGRATGVVEGVGGRIHFGGTRFTSNANNADIIHRSLSASVGGTLATEQTVSSMLQLTPAGLLPDPSTAQLQWDGSILYISFFKRTNSLGSAHADAAVVAVATASSSATPTWTVTDVANANNFKGVAAPLLAFVAGVPVMVWPDYAAGGFTTGSILYSSYSGSWGAPQTLYADASKFAGYALQGRGITGYVGVAYQICPVGTSAGPMYYDRLALAGPRSRNRFDTQII